MTPGRTLTEQLAISILAREGVAAAIWHLYLSAADAHRTGHSSAAAAILDIAEAAEKVWLRVEGERVLVPTEPVALTAEQQIRRARLTSQCEEHLS
jgi:hypothetical protein